MEAFFGAGSRPRAEMIRIHFVVDAWPAKDVGLAQDYLLWFYHV